MVVDGSSLPALPSAIQSALTAIKSSKGDTCLQAIQLDGSLGQASERALGTRRVAQALRYRIRKFGSVEKVLLNFREHFICAVRIFT